MIGFGTSLWDQYQTDWQHRIHSSGPASDCSLCIHFCSSFPESHSSFIAKLNRAFLDIFCSSIPDSSIALNYGTFQSAHSRLYRRACCKDFSGMFCSFFTMLFITCAMVHFCCTVPGMLRSGVYRTAFPIRALVIT